MSAYPSVSPERSLERNQWVESLRGLREAVSPDRPAAFFLEQELFASGVVGPVAAVFLANRECPWRCVHCDLWRHTLHASVLPGQIPAQVAHALVRLGPARQIKLYNSGSFFDPRAIPVEDHPAIARLVRGFERVIVECHPSLVGPRCLDFAAKLGSSLEVAMGLETVHPEALRKLNKRMTLEQFAAKAAWLRERAMAVRAFVVVGGPFQPAREAAEWACRSIEFAQACGAGVVSLILQRGGNGAMEALQAMGEWTPPRFADLEQALAFGLRLGGLRVFADLWAAAPECPACGPARVERLRRMNLTQQIEFEIQCGMCGGV